MIILDTLNFVAFKPLTNTNPVAIRRRKLAAKIDEQILLATDKTTRQRSTSGLLMQMVTNVKYKLLNVLSVGGLLVLMER